MHQVSNASKDRQRTILAAAGTAESAGRRARSGSATGRRQSTGGEVNMASPRPVNSSGAATPIAQTPSQGLASPSTGLGDRVASGSQPRSRRRSTAQPGNSSSQVLLLSLLCLHRCHRWAMSVQKGSSGSKWCLWSLNQPDDTVSH